MTGLSWVIGAGGLLGSGVVRALRAQGKPVFAGPKISWATKTTRSDLARGLSGFMEAAADGNWQIYWCAGAGVTDSSTQALGGEVAIFHSFLDAIGALVSSRMNHGGLFLSSSAGAIYAGAHDAPFDEASSVSPISSYGHSKLAIETTLREFSGSTGFRSLIGRISNIYGPGQNLAKPQGLISHLCHSSLTRTPLSIFVSLDTLRDYIYVDDCAEMIVAGAERLTASAQESPSQLKIIASQRSVTIGTLLNEFTSIAKNRPPVVRGSSPQTKLQSTDLRLRSTHWKELDDRPMVNLADGMARTLQDIRSSFLSTRTG